MSHAIKQVYNQQIAHIKNIKHSQMLHIMQVIQLSIKVILHSLFHGIYVQQMSK